jgi:hypothetical protein
MERIGRVAEQVDSLSIGARLHLAQLDLGDGVAVHLGDEISDTASGPSTMRTVRWWA